MIRAAAKDTVKVHYKGSLNDGTVFDQSPEDRPLLFIIGKGEVIKGFEDAVEGMYQGESKTVTIAPENAYGISDPELFQEVERSTIGDNVELQIGGQLEVTNHDGSIFHVMVSELTDDKVLLDANHPLAGKELVFDITLVEVTKEPQG